MLENLLSGVVGGAIVLIFEYTYVYFTNKSSDKKQQIVTFPNERKIIDGSIFSSLSPGANLELMKSVLGSPNKIYQEEVRVFEDSSIACLKPKKKPKPTNAYLYLFKNAQVKITSKDKETIDSLTVLTDDENISTEALMYPDETDENFKFGKTKVTREMLVDCRVEYIHGMRDNSFAISFFFPCPLYKNYTYFGTPDVDKNIDVIEYKPEDFIGGTIDGVCISFDDAEVYFIYDGELI